jgi:predicted O-methyltransferase YrrM
VTSVPSGGVLGDLKRKVVQRFGFKLVPAHFYGPVPEFDNIPSAHWSEPTEMPGVAISIDDHVTLMRDALAPSIAEFAKRLERSDTGAFTLDNGRYGPVDAELLYGVIRYFKPRRVLEFGSGYSTMVAALAARANAIEGRPTRITTVDPYPPDFLGGVAGIDEIVRSRVMDHPVEDLEALEPNDILFFDTTHTVKEGSDVNYAILSVLPRLAPGVVVHFHDIFLPWSYPRDWVVRRRRYWAEQYLLQAFLSMNSEYEVLLAAHWVARARTHQLADLVPSFGPDVQPGAFWIRRLAPVNHALVA